MTSLTRCQSRGRPAKYVPIARAADYIFGYTAEIDVSDRGGRGDRKMGGSDWLVGKNHDTFGPLGPFIVPKEFVKDAMNTRHTFTLNDQVMQDSNTGELCFGPVELVQYISTLITLAPGDLIVTGTPGGVGHARNPKVFLKRGQTVLTRIEGIGECRNVCA